MRNLCLLPLLVVLGLAAMRAPAGDPEPGFTSSDLVLGHPPPCLPHKGGGKGFGNARLKKSTRLFPVVLSVPLFADRKKLS